MSTEASALYVGRVMHRRTGRPRPCPLLPRLLDAARPRRDRRPRRAAAIVLPAIAPMSSRSRTADYGDRSGRPCGPRWRSGAEGRRHRHIRRPDPPSHHAAHPRYGFNPLSVFFCHRADGSLAATLYEVHNTFGEIHSYLIPAEGETRPIVQDSAKAFHVSPFLTRDDMSYRFACSRRARMSPYTSRPRTLRADGVRRAVGRAPAAGRPAPAEAAGHAPRC